jgi:hypothetical protein
MSPFPTTARAGDTLRIVRTWSDYPASAGWVLHITGVCSAGVISVTGTADSDDHVLAAAASVTADWDAGSYRVVEYVAKDTERHTVAEHSLQVLPDLAEADAGSDTRTHAERVLAHIEAFLERGTRSQIEIAGRRLSNYPLPELLALRDRYRAEVRQQSGCAVVGRLLTRFDR